jgi:hypothetical protein
MIRTNKRQFWKPMTALNRISKTTKEAEQPTVTPPTDMIMQFKNDTGKQVKIINGKEVLKDPPKNDLKADILKTKDEKDDVKYLPGQRFLKKLSKYKHGSGIKKKKLVDFDSDLSD